MTDLEINRALTLLSGNLWHHSPNGAGLNPNYTESLDTTYELAEKLGYSSMAGIGWAYEEDEFTIFETCQLFGPDRKNIPKKIKVVVDEKTDCLRAKRLALCEAILKAEGKWVEEL